LAPVLFVKSSTASKIRPIVMCNGANDGLMAMALCRKTHTSNTSYSVQVNPDGALNFDRRARRCSIDRSVQ
jgi:hypothetical protein